MSLKSLAVVALTAERWEVLPKTLPLAVLVYDGNGKAYVRADVWARVASTEGRGRRWSR